MEREAVEALWAKYPGEQVGVAAGAISDVAEVDVDTKHTTARKWRAERVSSRAEYSVARVP
jgi:hypothetical protein